MSENTLGEGGGAGIYRRVWGASFVSRVLSLSSLPLSPPLEGGVVTELVRGIRLYFHKLVEGLPALAAAKAQLGLGHSYSRSKVKFNVHRADNMIIQSISLLDQLDKDINTFSMRIRYIHRQITDNMC